MSVDLDHPRPECADYARILDAVTAERNALRAELIGVSRERDEAAVAWDTVRKERDEAVRRAADMDERFAFMRDGWSPFGGRGCALCVYEDGAFQRSCKLHEWADANWTAGEDDAAEAIAAKMQARSDLIAEEIRESVALFGDEPVSAKERRVLLEWIDILQTGAWRSVG